MKRAQKKDDFVGAVKDLLATLIDQRRVHIWDPDTSALAEALNVTVIDGEFLQINLPTMKEESMEEKTSGEFKQVLMRVPDDVWAQVQQIHEHATEGREGLRIPINSVLMRLLMIGIAHKAEF